MIVGFPGETEEDFLDTAEYLRDFEFKEIRVYRYSDRPNSYSSQFPGKVSEAENLYASSGFRQTGKKRGDSKGELSQKGLGM